MSVRVVTLFARLFASGGNKIDKQSQFATFRYMSTVIRISENLADKAKRRSSIEHRSMTAQVEYWAKIGKIAEENPDLPFTFIKEILLGLEELKEEEKEEYAFG